MPLANFHHSLFHPTDGRALLTLALLNCSCGKLIIDSYCPAEPCREETFKRVLSTDAGTEATAATSTNRPRSLLEDRVVTDAAMTIIGEQPAASQCGSLASRFTLRGCGETRLCHLQQTGCEVQILCGSEVFSGQLLESDKLQLSLPNGPSCSGTLSGDQFSVRCEDPNNPEDACDLISKNAFLPSPACVELPPLEEFDICGVPMRNCDWIQNSCQVQAECNGGSTIIQGQWLGDRLSIETDNSRCTGQFDQGVLRGTCVGESGSQCPWTMTTPPGASLPTCDLQWPSEGFTLTGCEREASACHLRHRQCIWDIACGSEVYGGRLSSSGEKMSFTSDLAASCTAHVDDNLLQGDCEWGAEYCHFSQAQPTAASSCDPLPEPLSLRYCGTTFDCETVQNGCQWQALCAQGSLRVFGEGGGSGQAQLAIGNTASCSLAPGDAGWSADCQFAQQLCDQSDVQLLATTSPSAPGGDNAN